MRVIYKNNQVYYKYDQHKMSDGVKVAILYYIIAILLFVFSVAISFLYFGNAPTFVAGIGISSILFNLLSMIYIIMEIYLYQNFHKEIRNMLLLQLGYFIFWIFIV